MSRDRIDEFIDDLSGEECEDTGFHPPICVNRDELEMTHDESVRENVKDDYEFVRKNLKQIIETNVKAMERLTKLAQESESPRTFEVMSTYMKQMVEANESLMKLHKEVKDITDQPGGGDGEGGDGGSGETNNYFVGSTEELLDMLEARDQRKKLGTVIEGEKTDDD